MSASLLWRCPRVARFFTLLEMLTGLAIMLVIAALLLGSLSYARQKGHEALCVNNLRECSIALLAYNQDYDGFLPPNEYVYGPYGACPPRSWDRVMIGGGYVSDTLIAHCPSQGPDGYEPGRVYGSFLRNPVKYENFDNTLRQLDVDPSRGMLLLDSIRVSDRQENWFYAHDSFGCWQQIHCRHGKQAGVLFFDGHVAKLGYDALVSSAFRPVPEYAHGHWYVTVKK